jgi:hypothetical protein
MTAVSMLIACWVTAEALYLKPLGPTADLVLLPASC